jgi:glycosyltransferase involved in cell wall biosynthesis
MSKIDVLLLSYNRPTMVKKAIESVLSQQLCDFTLYIMDDNSNSDTQKILKEYEKNYKNIVLYISNVKNENRLKEIRGAILLNIALKMSSSEYITYLTDDCYYLSNRLKSMSEYLDKHQDIYSVYGIQIVKDLADNELFIRGKDLGDVSQPHCKLDLNQIMHRRYVLEKAGYFEETDVERYICQADGEFFTRIANNFGQFKPIDMFTDVNVEHSKRLTLLLQSKESITSMFNNNENHE